MNAHPDTAARAAGDIHRQRLVAAETARLVKRAERSNLEPPSPRWLARLIRSLTSGGRTQPTAAIPTTSAITSMTNEHAWSQR
jgi:hypothetical protein